MPAHRIGPLVELEPVQHREGSGLGDALQHPEDSADVHEGRVDDRDAAANLRRRRRPVRLGAHHAVRKHVVGEVDPLRRPGGAAGQHPHRHTGSGGTAVFADRHHLWRGIERRDENQCRRRSLSDELRQIVGRADDHGQFQRGDVGGGAVITAGRVDHDDRSAGQQHPEERGDVCGPVAQQHADLSAAVDRCRDPAGQRRNLTVGEPLPVVLDRGSVGREVEHGRDALAQRVIDHHRSRGSDFTGPPCCASSAVPIGLPRRV